MTMHSQNHIKKGVISINLQEMDLAAILPIDGLMFLV